MKRGRKNAMGTGKIMWGLWVCFLMWLKTKKVASKKLLQMTLKPTAHVNIICQIKGQKISILAKITLYLVFENKDVFDECLFSFSV